jgi:hypothetical protein
MGSASAFLQSLQPVSTGIAEECILPRLFTANLAEHSLPHCIDLIMEDYFSVQEQIILPSSLSVSMTMHLAGVFNLLQPEISLIPAICLQNVK